AYLRTKRRMCTCGNSDHCGVCSASDADAKPHTSRPSFISHCWCPGRDLNPHSRCRKTDFKSVASADFATRARGADPIEPPKDCSVPLSGGDFTLAAQRYGGRLTLNSGCRSVPASSLLLKGNKRQFHDKTFRIGSK